MSDQAGTDRPADLPICLPRTGPNDLTVLLVIVVVLAGFWASRRWFFRRNRQAPRARRF